MAKGNLYKVRRAYRLKNYDVVVDGRRPEIEKKLPEWEEKKDRIIMVRAYLQMAKETLAGDLTKKYKVWLDKAVQDSGLEMLGQLGREYIDGTFAVSAKKNKDVKLKKEIRWLNQAIVAK